MVSFAEFWIELPKRINARCCSIEDVKREQRVWVEEQIELLNKEIAVLEGMPNSVQYHDEVWGRIFQIKFCKEMLEGLI